MELADYARACEERDAALAELAYYKGEHRDADQLVLAAALASRFKIKRGAVKTMLALHRARGRPLSLAALNEAVPEEKSADRNYSMCFKVWVHQIRRALGEDTIETVWGIGYRLTPTGLGLVSSLIKDVTAPIKEAA